MRRYLITGQNTGDRLVLLDPICPFLSTRVHSCPVPIETGELTKRHK